MNAAIAVASYASLSGFMSIFCNELTVLLTNGAISASTHARYTRIISAYFLHTTVITRSIGRPLSLARKSIHLSLRTVRAFLTVGSAKECGIDIVKSVGAVCGGVVEVCVLPFEIASSVCAIPLAVLAPKKSLNIINSAFHFDADLDEWGYNMTCSDSHELKKFRILTKKEIHEYIIANDTPTYNKFVKWSQDASKECLERASKSKATMDDIFSIVNKMNVDDSSTRRRRQS